MLFTERQALLIEGLAAMREVDLSRALLPIFDLLIGVRETVSSPQGSYAEISTKADPRFAQVRGNQRSQNP